MTTSAERARTRDRPVRVLVVDDSAVVRRILSRALSAHADIDVVGTAGDPYVARERIVALRPDVITLDIEMPRMDGLSFLSKLMQHRPLPVIIVSSLTPHNSALAPRALALGAVEVVPKPGPFAPAEDFGEQLVRAVRAASVARVMRRPEQPAGSESAQAGHTPRPPARSGEPLAVVALGASAGGPMALESVLCRFPHDAPGTLIVQHMPEGFTASFAKRLDAMCAMHVVEAKGGEEIVPGLALLAPGGMHLVAERVGSRLVAALTEGPKVHHQRPAVDVLFHSVARAAGQRAAGALLTGMGGDGARGMLAMREAGAFTVAQDEATCVVYGMPREAVMLGAAMESLPLDEIARALLVGRVS